MTVKIGVYGATGYTGLELIALLERHPDVEIVFLTSESSAGQSLRQQWPTAPDMTLVSAADAPLAAMDGVFLCLPHTKSAPLAVRALDAGANAFFSKANSPDQLVEIIQNVMKIQKRR